MKIQGKVFVVTGGASGLGAATATYLVGQGATVIMVDMNDELGMEMQQRLGEHSVFVKLDVTDEHAVKIFFEIIFYYQRLLDIGNTMEKLKQERNKLS